MVNADSKFKDLFCQEATDQLAILSRELLSIEKDPGNVECYATLMRAAHTIKGAAATMGYTEMAKLAHSLEDVFHLGERSAIRLGSKEISVAFSAIDQLGLSLTSIKEHGTELSASSAIDVLLAVAKGNNSVSGIAQNKPLSEPGSTTHQPQLTSALPTSVRVDVERLDALMGLFEEMLMVRLRLDSLLEPAQHITKNLIDRNLKEQLYFLKEFDTLFSQLARLLSETQTQLLVIRLVPVELIFSQFPRMVRDLSLRENKKVELFIEGSEVELDRTVLGGLGGALAHLLRNAIDHGIEQQGEIILAAKHVNDRVHVSVEDNGRGIDYERVRTVATERGVVTADVAQRLRTQEIAELLFHPHMSTNTEVTDISGRGVGLSAVQAFAKDVGGHVTVTSPVKDSKGTRFVLDLPVSLATVKVLLIESSKFTFALPFTMMVKTVQLKQSEIIRVLHQEMVEIDGGLVPLLYLNKLLDITFADMFLSKAKKVDSVLAVLLAVNGEHFLLGIDECIGEQELLIKSLPPILRDVRGFSGSALLPDGRTILLLDAHGLLTEVQGDILGSTKS